MKMNCAIEGCPNERVRRSYCDDCHRRYRKIRARDEWIFQERLVQQLYQCPICLSSLFEKKPHFDHAHNYELLRHDRIFWRAVLCSDCNCRRFGDNEEIISRAALYIKKWRIEEEIYVADFRKEETLRQEVLNDMRELFFATHL